MLAAFAAEGDASKIHGDPAYERSWWAMELHSVRDDAPLFLLRRAQAATATADGTMEIVPWVEVGDPPTMARLETGVQFPFGLSGNGEALSLGQSGVTLWDMNLGTMVVSSLRQPYQVAPDVSGDGRLDLCGGDALAMSDTYPWRVVPFPAEPIPGEGAPEFVACLPDMNGDGLGDLLLAHHSPSGIWYPSRGGPVSFHVGGADGYDGAASWVSSELFFDAPYAMVAVQRDGDPELELAVLTTALHPYGDWESSTLVLIDDVGTDPRRVGAFPTFAYQGDEPPSMPQLVNLGDIDGDGFDDIAIPEARGYGKSYDTGTAEDVHHIRIVSAASDGPVVRELATLRFDVDEASVESMSIAAADLNGDAVPDLFGMFCGLECYLQIWYGPLSDLIEPPGDTSGTGHTGAPATTDTGANPATGPTGDTAGSKPPVTKSTGPTAKRCGCTAATSPAPFSWISRRRGNR